MVSRLFNGWMKKTLTQKNRRLRTHRQEALARRRRLLLESLEERRVLATFYVDSTPTIGGPGADQFTASGGSQVNVGSLTLGVNLFTTIQDAVNAAALSGDTINVSDGTYSELVSVNKSVLLRGNQAGVDARTRAGTFETVVNGAVSGLDKTTSFYFTAANATLDGFTVRDQSHRNQFGAGIVMGPSGITVRNNIIT